MAVAESALQTDTQSVRTTTVTASRWSLGSSTASCICVCVCVCADLYECAIAANRTENSERRMLKLKKLLHELPEHNFETFRFLAQHLNKVATWEEQNKVSGFDVTVPKSPFDALGSFVAEKIF